MRCWHSSAHAKPCSGLLGMQLSTRAVHSAFGADAHSAGIVSNHPADHHQMQSNTLPLILGPCSGAEDLNARRQRCSHPSPEHPSWILGTPCQHLLHHHTSTLVCMHANIMAALPASSSAAQDRVHRWKQQQRQAQSVPLPSPFLGAVLVTPSAPSLTRMLWRLKTWWRWSGGVCRELAGDWYSAGLVRVGELAHRPSGTCGKAGTGQSHGSRQTDGHMDRAKSVGQGLSQQNITEEQHRIVFTTTLAPKTMLLPKPLPGSKKHPRM